MTRALLLPLGVLAALVADWILGPVDVCDQCLIPTTERPR
jgi:hypothetical protein